MPVPLTLLDYNFTSLRPVQGWVMRQPAVARRLSLIPQPAATQHAVMSCPDMLTEATAEGSLQPGEPVGLPLSPSAQTTLPPQELVSEEVQTQVARAGDPHELLLKVSPASHRFSSQRTPALHCGGTCDVIMKQAHIRPRLPRLGTSLNSPHAMACRLRS